MRALEEAKELRDQLDNLNKKCETQVGALIIYIWFVYLAVIAEYDRSL